MGYRLRRSLTCRRLGRKPVKSDCWVEDIVESASAHDLETSLLLVPCVRCSAVSSG